MRAAVVNRVGSARAGGGGGGFLAGGAVASATAGLAAAVVGRRTAAGVTTSVRGGGPGGGAGGAEKGGGGKTFGDLGSAWSRNIPSSKAHVVVGGGVTNKPQPPVGVGAGWVDVSAALGEGHVEAAAEVNSLVKPMSLEKLLNNPNAKGYSE
jgi:hypothetical protein